MGFVDYNSFGKFSAEAIMPLPTFSAESLLSLSGRQFAAATIDGDSITNYDPDNYVRFHVGDGGTGAGSHTTNSNGSVRTRSDKGFNFVMAATAAGTQLVTLAHDSTDLSKKDFTFTLKPGDNLKRNGANHNIVYIPADGSDPVTTHVPWIRGGSYNITLDAVTPITPDGGTGETGGTGASSTCATENRAANTDDTCGDCLSGFTEDSTGVCVADATEEGEETNWLLYGGAFALLAVGGFMAVKMMKKKK